ncbi:serine protease [Virgisporangium ochraceum]|uniref:Serine protease n=2 Tax=Virgisporangium ochraceum TaxID=65505 RepID=A0A8J4E9D7_9ACTN|nr:serine protease [Virgisporangium ochraceum]
MLAALLLAPAALIGAPGVALAGPGTFDTPDRKGNEPVTVTLITGDKVVVSGSDRLRIEPGPGRGRITFDAARIDGRLRVVPGDVRPLLQAGTVDSRLFDITGLVEFGYDDKRGDLPLIVTGAASSARSAPAGVSVVRTIPGGTAVTVAKNTIGAAWKSLAASVRAEGTTRGGQASKIWLDGKRKPVLKDSVPQIGAPAAWAAGLDGSGIKVAVVDSGVDGGHPDLVGRVVAAENFTTDPDNADLVGHGTHVAATIASTGAAPGGYKGVAPGASLLAAKVCSIEDCSDSSIIAGMQWAAEQGAKVANVSLGGYDTPEQDPVEAAVERLTTEFGMLFVIAAGNDPREASVASPGSTDAALTVGAVDKSDGLAPFSSRGPRVGDSALKPDITAPGVDITAALSRSAEVGAPPGTTHFSASGTSMATPHVAGSAAILAQQHPTWTATEIKAALMGSAKPNPEIGVYAQGAGRVDVARSITQTVTSSPASVSFGMKQWPHNDDEPDARTVTYRNAGTAEVTLTLRLDGTLPAGLFSLSATTVTVPAGGTADVTLTSDTRANAPDGRLGGRIVATAGTAQVVTPFAVDKEIESYTVTVNRIDASGKPTTDGSALLVNLDTGNVVRLDSPGAIEARVPKGRYALIGDIYDLDALKWWRVVDTTVVVDRALTLTVDARVAKPVSVSVPAADAEQVVGYIDLTFNKAPEWGASFILFDSSLDGMFVGQVDPAEREPSLASSIGSQLVRGPVPDEGPLVTPSPYAYFLAEEFKGHAPAGYAGRFTDRDLARVETAYSAQGIPAGSTSTFGGFESGGQSVGRVMPVTLPGKRIDHFAVKPGLTWTRDLYEGDWLEPVNVHTSVPTAFQAGRTTSERVNAAVFGPAFGPFDIAARLGDEMLFGVGQFAGAGNWTGFSNSTGRTVVTRNGQVIFDQPSVGAYLPEVPPGDAAFTVKIDANRPAPNKLSTRVNTEWTFRSATVTGTEPGYLPLSVVRFAPPLSPTNTAPAGKVWLVPVEVQRQPNSAAGRARTLTVEVSYDDGATWSRAPVVRSGQNGVVLLKHPARAGFVSLRTSSADTAGNTVKQTVIRAYEIA